MKRHAIRVVAFVLAFSPLAAGAQGYVRARTERTDLPLYWSSRCFVWRAGAAGSARTPGGTEFEALRRAFDEWQSAAASCGNEWTFVEGAPLPVNDYRIGFRDKEDNENVVLFRELACSDVVPEDDPCHADPRTAHVLCANAYQCWYDDPGSVDTIAQTLTTYRTKTGEIVDADVEFNAAPLSGLPPHLFTTVDDPVCPSLEEQRPDCVAFDVENTLVHEIGHALGLEHVEDDPESTMFPNAAMGALGMRSLDEGSTRGLCEIYPPGSGAAGPQCSATGISEQHISASSVGTRFELDSGCSAGGSTSSIAIFAPLMGVLFISNRRRLIHR